jgi:hypothetical protein
VRQKKMQKKFERKETKAREKDGKRGERKKEHV